MASFIYFLAFFIAVTIATDAFLFYQIIKFIKKHVNDE